MRNTVAIAASMLLVAACAEPEETPSYPYPEETAEAPAQLVLGNGADNASTTEGITRAGSVFTVPEVTIARNGWLIMHPFRDGAPVGNEYVGSTRLEAGTTQDVEIDVGEAPETGDMFILMFHNDVNDDGVFDFGDGDKNVPDEPTFENGVMIAHAIAAPEDSGS